MKFEEQCINGSNESGSQVIWSEEIWSILTPTGEFKYYRMSFEMQRYSNRGYSFN
jgi:hypothetical protein